MFFQNEMILTEKQTVDGGTSGRHGLRRFLMDLRVGSQLNQIMSTLYCNVSLAILEAQNKHKVISNKDTLLIAGHNARSMSHNN